MSDTIIIGILSFAGTCVGAIAGILAANKLSNYRIEQLEKKVEAHNQLIGRTYKLEQKSAIIEEEIKDIRERI